MNEGQSSNSTNEDKSPTTEAESTLPLSPSCNSVEQIGPFRVLELLGSGGMGDVYLAEQIKPIKRKVALKVIKMGMDTKEVIARFESERQALAMMNHPNVAKIHDAGSTDNGRPYFVMEYVAGESITKYCDRHKLDIKSRLELFSPVCQAIHHAHQKGIIHRDIKPSNVLVTIQDGQPIPKVIDFGVAKATQQRLTERTIYTEHGRLIGTPAYMSPEQAEMTGLNIDTSSDVYSLGVLLYEILVGSLPFGKEELLQAGVMEMNRIIREVDPPKPSTKISTIGEQAADIAAKRKVGPKRWRNQLKGELDWIIMRAMEKDRTRRYQSASEFAADIGRYLTNEPVHAHRPSATYQLKKLVIKYKVRFGMLALLVVLLAGFGVTTSIQAGRIARERDRANQEAETAGQISGFLVDLFKVSDPSESKGNTITAREILDDGVVKIEGELLDQPLVRARLMEVMGSVYGSLALYDPAIHLLEDALRAKQELLGREHLGVARSLNSLGNLLYEIGDYEEARPLYERSLAIWEKTLGPDHPAVASNLNNLGILLVDIRDFEGARPLYERSLAIREKALGPDHPDVASSLNNLGILLYDIGDYEGARPLYERSLAIWEKALGPDHPIVASGLINLANLLSDIGDYEGARLFNERSLAIREKALGPGHPDVASSLNNLGILLYGIGDYEGARPLYERSLAIREKFLGPDHPDVATSLNNLGLLLAMVGDYERAQLFFERSLVVYENNFGPKDLRALGSLYNMACIASVGKNRDKAIGLLYQILERDYTDEEMWIAEDSDFDFLHGDPEFEAIVAEIKKRNEDE